MARNILHLLPGRARVLRESRVPDGQGGWITTQAEIAASVPCRPAGVRLEMFDDVDGQLIAQPQRAIYFTADADVRTHDLIELGDEVWRAASVEVQIDGAYSKALCDTEQRPA